MDTFSTKVMDSVNFLDACIGLRQTFEQETNRRPVRFVIGPAGAKWALPALIRTLHPKAGAATNLEQAFWRGGAEALLVEFIGLQLFDLPVAIATNEPGVSIQG